MYNQKFIIRENLTLKRRLLSDRVKEELVGYKYGWVRNGCVYVRKNKGDRAIKVNSEEALNKLLKESAGHPAAPVVNVVSTRSSPANRSLYPLSHRGL